MARKDSHPAVLPSQEQRRDGPNQTARSGGVRVHEGALVERDRKLRSLLELGQIIGLDLQIDAMLVQIAQKAAEVMGAERCSLFLYDPKTDELWSTVALGMEGQQIRIPSRVGAAGHCFTAGETLILADVYADPRFNKEVDARTGYRTRNLLCVPLYNRAGERIGVIQLLNKKTGEFSGEDETFLKNFANHASVFIEIAQLQRARVEALEESRDELRQLNRAKDRALHHLSHELKTPLAVTQGTIRLLKMKLRSSNPPADPEKSFDILEKNLARLFGIQQEADQIIRSYQKVEEGGLHEDLDRLGSWLEGTSGAPSDLLAQLKDVKSKLVQYLPPRHPPLKPIPLYPLIKEKLEKSKDKAGHREIRFILEGRRETAVLGDPQIIGEVVESLLKNAIESTPDEGVIRIELEEATQRGLLKIQDFGIGITKENQKFIFDGLFTTQETEFYSSKRPYDFGAGGKGLELLLMRSYGKRFGFDFWLESKRCVHLPTDRDLCPGRISKCPHCRKLEDCLGSGGSILGLSFVLKGGSR